MAPALKVLHVFDRYLNHTMNWAYQLMKHTPGVEVSVSAPVIIRNRFFDPAFHIYIPSYQQVLSENEWQIGWKVKMRSFLAARVTGAYQRQVYRILREQGIELMHAHFAQAGCRVMEVAKKSGVPLVVSFYGYDYEWLPYHRPRYRKLYQRLFSEAAAFICEGNHGAGVLAGMGCPPEKIHVVHLGIDPEVVPFHRRNHLPGSLRLLQAATYREKKGQLDTLRAFQKALGDCPDMSLTLVGEAAGVKLKKTIDDFIADKGLSDKVRQLDFVDSARFYEFVRDFDVFIHPSCYTDDRDCEGGAPVVLLDVQATGMPVISTTHCDIPEEVVDGRTGILSAEKDIAALAGAIGRFYKMDAPTYQAFSENARRHVEAEYDIRQSGRQLYALYQKFTKRT